MKEIIWVDTREQTPYFLLQGRPKYLITGDYSLPGLEKYIAIERKSKSDLFRCVGHKFYEFRDQLERLKEIPFRAVIIDVSRNEILKGSQFSTVWGTTAVYRLEILCAERGIPIHYAKNHEHAGDICKSLLNLAKEAVGNTWQNISTLTSQLLGSSRVFSQIQNK